MSNDRGTACRLLRQLREQRGWSWADQARALRAVAEQLGVTAPPRAPRDQVQRGIIGTDLAIARLRAGDVRSATTLLYDSVDTTAATGGRVAALRIARARRELAPWRTESFVTELDDHIYDAFLAN